MKIKCNKTLGGLFIIAGTTLGAGILALPIALSGAGLMTSVIAIIIFWSIMTYTALLILELNLRLPHGASFSTMAKLALGRYGQMITFSAMIMLFYSLLAAYISGATDLISNYMNLLFGIQPNHGLIAISFTAIFAVIIIWETTAVDYFNRILLSIKIAALIVTVLIMLSASRHHFKLDSTYHVRYIWVALPVVFTAFGFHGSIPTVVKYVNQRVKQLLFVIIVGSLVPLIIYLVWLAVSSVGFPRTGQLSFYALAQTGNSLGLFTDWLSQSFSNPLVKIGINLFSDIAVTTSFLVVGLGLYDYFRDLYSHLSKRHRIKSGFSTFIPPLLFVLLFQHSFVFALGVASIPLAILAVLLPCLMVVIMRKKQEATASFQVPGGMTAIGVAFIFGVFVIIMQICAIFHTLPRFGFN